MTIAWAAENILHQADKDRKSINIYIFLPMLAGKGSENCETDYPFPFQRLSLGLSEDNQLSVLKWLFSC